MNSHDSNPPPSTGEFSPSQQPVSLHASAASVVADAPLVPSKIRKVLRDHEDKLGEIPDILLILKRVVDQVGELEKDMKAQKLRINSVWDATSKLHGDDPIEWSAKEFSGLAKGWAAFHAKRYEEWKNGQKGNKKAYTEEEQQKKRAEREEKTKKAAERRELGEKLIQDFMEAKLKRERGEVENGEAEDGEAEPAQPKQKKSRRAALDV